MITGTQIRSARAALDWSAKNLADKAQVVPKTIIRFEAVDGIPPSRSSTLLAVTVALEAAGIEFIGTPEEGPGVRLWPKKKRKKKVRR